MEEKRKVLYSNKAELSFQLFDIVMRFTTSLPENDRHEMIEVIMSPQHAKAFSIILKENVQAYEDTFGPISIEPVNSEVDKVHKNVALVKGD